MLVRLHLFLMVLACARGATHFCFQDQRMSPGMAVDVGCSRGYASPGCGGPVQVWSCMWVSALKGKGENIVRMRARVNSAVFRCVDGSDSVHKQTTGCP